MNEADLGSAIDSVGCTRLFIRKQLGKQMQTKPLTYTVNDGDAFFSRASRVRNRETGEEGVFSRLNPAGAVRASVPGDIEIFPDPIGDRNHAHDTIMVRSDEGTILGPWNVGDILLLIEDQWWHLAFGCTENELNKTLED